MSEQSARNRPSALIATWRRPGDGAYQKAMHCVMTDGPLPLRKRQPVSKWSA